MKALFRTLIAVSWILVSGRAFANPSFDQNFIEDVIRNGQLKQAVRAYVEKQSGEDADVDLAHYFFGSDRSRQALLRDIDRSDYDADLDGTHCSELKVQGEANEEIEAETRFNSESAAICFNVPGIVQNYGSRSREEGLSILISYALHEHAHHFQQDPGSDLNLRAGLEHQAYELQTFVLNKVNSNSPVEVAPLRSEDNHRPLVAGDKVILITTKSYIPFEDRKDPWAGMSSEVFNGDFGLASLTTDNLEPSELTVVATKTPGYIDQQDVAVVGTLNGKPVSLLTGDSSLARSFGKTSHGVAVGDVGEIQVAMKTSDFGGHNLDRLEDAGLLSTIWLKMKVRVVGIYEIGLLRANKGLLVVELLEPETMLTLANGEVNLNAPFYVDHDRLVKSGMEIPDLVVAPGLNLHPWRNFKGTWLEYLEQCGFPVKESLHQYRTVFGKAFRRR